MCIRDRHISPESAVGGPLAIVRDGDEIELDTHARQLELHVPEAEIKKRQSQWKPNEPHYERGYGKMYLDHILQAHEGCDFDFLQGRNGRGSGDPLKLFRNPAL